MFITALHVLWSMMSLPYSVLEIFNWGDFATRSYKKDTFVTSMMLKQETKKTYFGGLLKHKKYFHRTLPFMIHPFYHYYLPYEGSFRNSKIEKKFTRIQPFLLNWNFAWLLSFINERLSRSFKLCLIYIKKVFYNSFSFSDSKIWLVSYLRFTIH